MAVVLLGAALNVEGQAVVWKFPLPPNDSINQAYFFGSPAVGPGSLVYVASLTNLYAVSPNGSFNPPVAWFRSIALQANHGAAPSPSIASAGTVYVPGNEASTSLLYAFHGLDGTSAWTTDPSVNGLILSTPAIGADGTIYFGADDATPNLCDVTAVSPNGSVAWGFHLDNGPLGTGDVDSSLGIGANGMLFCLGEHNNELTALTPPSPATSTWKTSVPTELSQSLGTYHFNSSPGIGADGTLYIGSAAGVYAIRATDGSFVWTQPALGSDYFQSSPAIGKSGTIYIGGSDGYLHAINSAGTPQWAFAPTDSGWTFWGATVYGSPAVACDGTIYIVMYNFQDGFDYLVAVQDNGTSAVQRWRVQLDYDLGSYPLSGSPVIGGDGTVYVTQQATLYAIQSSPTPLPPPACWSPWPMFQHDAMHSGRKNNPGTLDLTYGYSGSGANQYVSAVAVQPDGKALIGGAFTSVDGVLHNYLVRLNYDGSLDTAFSPTLTGGNPVKSIVVQSDGKILIGGDFTEGGNQYVARLTTTGANDTSFTPPSLNGEVAAIALDGSQILIAGQFTSPNAHVARLNSNGTLDTGFNPGTGPSGTVSAAAVQGDGRVLVGGSFTWQAGKSTLNNLVRLSTSGAVDTSYAPNPNNLVAALLLQSDGKLLVGGGFTSIGGVSRSCIARLLSAGSGDTTFSTGTGLNSTAMALALQCDGKVLIGGSFTTANGAAHVGVVRLNTDGSVDSRYSNPALAGPVGGIVQAVGLQATAQAVIGGNFNSVGGQSRLYVARLNNE